MASFSFPVPIESVPLFDDRLTVGAAARQLALAGGQPAILLDRATHPVGLLFPHRLLDPDLPPGRLLGSLSTTLLEVVPLIRSTITLEMLHDCAHALRHPTARYVIAIEEGGRAIGVIDLVTLPALESTDRDLSMVVERFSHEVASPLMGVLSLATLLNDERLASLSEVQQKQVQAISHGADRIAYELERLDLVSRIRMGKTILYDELTTLMSLFGQVIAQARDRCQRSHPEPEENLTSWDIASTTISIDRRYSLHLFAAAIECVLGRYGSWQDLHLSAQVLEGDLMVSLQSLDPMLGRNLTPLSLLKMIPADRTEVLIFLRILVHFVKGDLSLKPVAGAGFQLTLLLPNIVVSESDLDTTTSVSGLDRVETFDADTLNSNISSHKTGLIETRDGDSLPSSRAIVLTRHLQGQDLALLDQPGWYIAIAVSIDDLLDKVARLSPKLVILDCATYDDYHSVTQHLIRHLDKRAIAIATLRHRPTRINPSSLLESRLTPEPFGLHYPLRPSDISSCFEWARVMRSTIVLVDLRDPPSPTADSQPTNIKGSSIADQLRRHHCRTIEVNDLDRAQLFAEIWRPHAIVLQFLPDSAVTDWPQKIEILADRVGIPCLIFHFGNWSGQACRLDRSIVYWPESSQPKTSRKPDVIPALQWLQHHHQLLR